MTLNTKIGVLWIFWRFRAATQVYHSQGGATVLSFCALQHDCNKGVVFHPKFPQI